MIIAQYHEKVRKMVTKKKIKIGKTSMGKIIVTINGRGVAVAKDKADAKRIVKKLKKQQRRGRFGAMDMYRR